MKFLVILKLFICDCAVYSPTGGLGLGGGRVGGSGVGGSGVGGWVPVPDEMIFIISLGPLRLIFVTCSIHEGLSGPVYPTKAYDPR